MSRAREFRTLLPASGSTEFPRFREKPFPSAGIAAGTALLSENPAGLSSCRWLLLSSTHSWATSKLSKKTLLLQGPSLTPALEHSVKNHPTEDGRG